LQDAQTALSESWNILYRQHRHSRSRARHIQMDDIVSLTENFSRLSAGSVISVEESNSLSRKRNLH
jgi:5-bromo-4-chloroindolyl phosphate hydrolysis protein